MRKRLLSLLLCSIAGMSFAGCGSASNTHVKSETAQSAAENVEEKSEENAESAGVDGQSSGEEAAKEGQEEEKVLVDNEIAVITYTGVNREATIGPEINLSVKNKSEQDITIKVSDISIDGAAVDSMCKIDVPKDGEKKGKINITQPDVNREFKALEGKLKITDKDNNSKEEAFSLNY